MIKRIESSDENKTVVAAFDGIYPFNYIEFNVDMLCPYKVYSFNGLSYDLIAEGVSEDSIVKIHLPNAVEGCYQIKLTANSKIQNIIICNI